MPDAEEGDDRDRLRRHREAHPTADDRHVVGPGPVEDLLQHLAEKSEEDEGEDEREQMAPALEGDDRHQQPDGHDGQPPAGAEAGDGSGDGAEPVDAHPGDRAQDERVRPVREALHPDGRRHRDDPDHHDAHRHQPALAGRRRCCRGRGGAAPEGRRRRRLRQTEGGATGGRRFDVDSTSGARDGVGRVGGHRDPAVASHSAATVPTSTAATSVPPLARAFSVRSASVVSRDDTPSRTSARRGP